MLRVRDFRFGTVAAMVAATAMLGAALHAADVMSLSFDFESDAAGELPKGWSIHENKGKGTPGAWKIVEDAKAGGGKKVLALTKSENAGGTFNQVVFDKADFANVDVTVKFRGDTGIEDQGGGIMWRWKDADNYYIVRGNPLESNIRIYTVAKGVRSKALGEAKPKMDAGKWYTLRVVHVGEKIEVYLDGQKIIDAAGAVFDAGKVGLWTKADAATSFDDLTIKVPGK